MNNMKYTILGGVNCGIKNFTIYFRKFTIYFFPNILENAAVIVLAIYE